MNKALVRSHPEHGQGGVMKRKRKRQRTKGVGRAKSAPHWRVLFSARWVRAAIVFVVTGGAGVAGLGIRPERNSPILTAERPADRTPEPDVPALVRELDRYFSRNLLRVHDYARDDKQYKIILQNLEHLIELIDPSFQQGVSSLQTWVPQFQAKHGL